MSGRLSSLLAVGLWFGGVFAAGCGGSDVQSCPGGTFWDAQSGQCVAAQGCPPGTSFNGQTCVAGGGVQQCPQGTSWNGAQCVAAQPQCPMGQSWNGTQCVIAGGMLGGGGACPPAQAADPMTATAATQGLGLMAGQNAQGATPVGGALVGNFQTGQCLEAQIMLQPGKCYTAVGNGAGPGDIEVSLVTVPPPPPFPQISQPLSVDQSAGPTAVMAGAPNCFRSIFPVPTPAKFVLKVTQGTGVAAAQLYEK